MSDCMIRRPNGKLGLTRQQIENMLAFNGVNWAQHTTAAISRRLEISRRTIRLWRIKHGFPECINKWTQKERTKRNNPDDKFCTKCLKWLPKQFFGTASYEHNGLSRVCRECCAVASLASRSRVKSRDIHAYKMRELIHAATARTRKLKLPPHNLWEHFDQLIERLRVMKCEVTGCNLEIGNSKCSDYSPTLDKIDSGLDYNYNNVQILSFWANKIKNKYHPGVVVLLGKAYFQFGYDPVFPKNEPPQPVNSTQTTL